MKPPPFLYHAPESLEEVVALLAEHGGDARCMAGGQSLIPLMNLRMARPEVIIDLNRCRELMRIDRGQDSLVYGAMVRAREAEQSDETVTGCPLIPKALLHAGPIAVRNRSTVGGMLAHADRTAELPGVAVALDAMLVITSAEGEREVAATEFFLGDMTTAIEPNEMLKATRFPLASTGAYTEFFEAGVRQEGVAIAGLAAQVLIGESGAVEGIRLAATGVESAPVRLKSVEELLLGSKLDELLIAEAAKLGGSAVGPVDDPFVPARYRRRVTETFVKRALQGAVNQRNANV